MKNEAKTSPEFDRFDALVGAVLSAPSEAVKRQIEEERQRRKAPKKKASKEGKGKKREGDNQKL